MDSHTHLCDLPRDILLVIYDMLAPIYKIMFTCSSARIAKKMPPCNIYKIIRDRGGALIDLIIEYGGSITGGFMLDCLFDTYYSQDIDVLFDIGAKDAERYPADEASPGTKLYKFRGFRHKLRSRGKLIADKTVLCNENDEITCTVRKYIYEGHKVDVIICEADKLSFIDQYDLDFCKILYDDSGLMMRCLSNVLRKESLVRKTKNCSAMERYKNRVRITEIIRTTVRQDKYIARGFRIIT